MDIFEYKDFKIACSTFSTPTSWGHEAIVYYKDNIEAKAKCRYYNRTWESYKYQSVILNGLYNIIEKRRNYIIVDYKQKHDVYRMTKVKKEELYKKDSYLQDVMEAYEHFKRSE